MKWLIALLLLLMGCGYHPKDAKTFLYNAVDEAKKTPMNSVLFTEDIATANELLVCIQWLPDNYDITEIDYLDGLYEYDAYSKIQGTHIIFNVKEGRSKKYKIVNVFLIKNGSSQM